MAALAPVSSMVPIPQAAAALTGAHTPSSKSSCVSAIDAGTHYIALYTYVPKAPLNSAFLDGGGVGG